MSLLEQLRAQQRIATDGAESLFVQRALRFAPPLNAAALGAGGRDVSPHHQELGVYEAAGCAVFISHVPQMHDNEPLRTIIQTLEDVQCRPGLYLGPFMDSPEHVISFFSGMRVTVHALHITRELTDNIYEMVVQARGWADGSTRGRWEIMREHGLDDVAIVQELLTIEIETWKRRYSVSEAGAQGSATSKKHR